jgi:hypothetical protein
MNHDCPPPTQMRYNDSDVSTLQSVDVYSGQAQVDVCMLVYTLPEAPPIAAHARLCAGEQLDGTLMRGGWG